MPNTIGYTRRRGTDARFLGTVGRVSGLSEQTEIVDGVNTAGLLLHKPQLQEPRLRVRDRAKPFRTSLRSFVHPTSPPKSVSGPSSTADWGGRVKIWREWLDECNLSSSRLPPPIALTRLERTRSAWVCASPPRSDRRVGLWLSRGASGKPAVNPAAAPEGLQAVGGGQSGQSCGHRSGESRHGVQSSIPMDG